MAKIPIGSGFKAGWGFLRFFKLFFYSIFFIYLLVSIVLTGFQKKDFGVVIKELGEEFYNPLQNAQEYSLEIQNNEVEGILSSIWKYWGFYFNLGMIYLWIRILSWLVGHSPFSNTSNSFINWGLGIISFYVIQLLFGAYYLKESPMFVFEATKDVFNGLVYLFTHHNFKIGSESLITPKNNCNESLCTI